MTLPRFATTLIIASIFWASNNKCNVEAVSSRTKYSSRSMLWGLRVRGGAGMYNNNDDNNNNNNDSSPYQLNPNYVPPNSPDSFSRYSSNFEHQQEIWIETQTFQNNNEYAPASPSSIRSSSSSSSYYNNNKVSLWDLCRRYISTLHTISPTLSYGSLSCIVVFVLWQIPKFHPLLQNYFVCSRRNVLAGRLPAILLSAISHASFMHLLVNLVAFVTFGPTVKTLLNTSSWPLWPFVVGSSVVSSLTYLLLQSRRIHGGCMGLSGVTLSLLAMKAKAFPEQELGIVLGIIPVRLPADILLKILLVWSVLGSLLPSQSNIAHLTHLGGLLFGIGYYEFWDYKRQQKRSRMNKFFY